MSATITIDISDILKEQEKNRKRIADLEPNGALGGIVKTATQEAWKYIVSITHVDTGSYRAAQRMSWEGGLTGVIFVDPSAVNPKGNKRPAVYSVYEEARGEDHAAYARTVAEAGGKIIADAGEQISLKMSAYQ